MSDAPKPTDAKTQYAQALQPKGPAEAKDIEEKTLWSGGYSAKAMFGSWLLAAIVSIGLIVAAFYFREAPAIWTVVGSLILVLWVVLLGMCGYQKLSHRYELTNQRLKHRDGILVQTTNRVELIDVDDVMFKQGPIQLLLNVGTITVKSSDVSHPMLVLKGIAEVKKVADSIDDARRAERRRRGVFVESV